MVAHIIWDDGAQFESDIFYFVQTMRSRVQISVSRLQNGVDLVTHFPHKEGYVGSNPTSATVTVADLVMRRIVVPDYAGPNPVSHLNTHLRTAVYEFIGSHSNLFLDMTFNHNAPWCNG